MPPKSKVEQSSNYNQILDWIGEGKSSRWISRELENQFNEKIGHVAISNFRKKNILPEAMEIVDIQLKEEEKQKRKKEAEEKKEREDKKKQVAKISVEREQQADEKIRGLAETTARHYKSLLNVADNFEDDYYKMKNAVHDNESKVTEKDVAEMSFKALKLSYEISKDDSSMEDSINDGFGELADAIKKSREISKTN